MAYELLTKLDSSTISSLNTLKDSVTFLDKKIRLGENRTNNMSVYKYSKWTTWNRTQKSDFKDCFESSDIEKSVIGWFLNFPANTGFLDNMTYWNDKDGCGTVISYALEAQSIIIDGTTVNLEAGQGIKFKLNQSHKIETSSSARNWACIMMMV